jgi:hypothetical protein
MLVSSVAGACWAAGQSTAPRSATLVKEFMPKDLPSTQPGRSAWEPAQGGADDIACHGNAVYAVSGPARCLVRFDHSAGSMDFKDGIALDCDPSDKEAGRATLHIRALADGSTLVYVFFVTHHQRPLLCFAVDRKTGVLTLKGKTDDRVRAFANSDPGCDCPADAWSPDQNRLYYIGVKKIAWYTFDTTSGLPVQEAKEITCTNPGKASRGRHAILSPDGKQLYAMVEKAAPAGNVFWQVDTYDCDPTTGNLTFNSALDLPDLPRGTCNEFMGFAPDGKRLYLIDEGAACHYSLARELAKGTLSILTSGKPDRSMAGVAGPPWRRGGKWVIGADGKSGFYLGGSRNRVFGSFAIDPAIGVWSDFSTTPGPWMKIAFDPGSGDLFLVGGERISFFTTTRPGKAGP